MNSRYSRSLNRCRLTTAILSTFLISGAAFAQDAASNSGEDSEQKESSSLDRIEVVGSRIKRAEVEGPAPVTVISRTEMEREGYQTVGDVLQTLTQGSTSSFTGELAVTGFTPNAQVVNLRNLGPGYTLTLINGRRPAQYPQPYNRDNNVVNVAAIPSSIVERIEVLTGGASAIYGSDAIAGVVNVVLRENYDGNLLALTVGTTAEGGGDSVNLTYTGGRVGDNWSTVYALEYRNEEPVFASQRDFLSDTRKGPLGPGFTNPALSLAVLNFNGVQRPPAPTIRARTSAIASVTRPAPRPLAAPTAARSRSRPRAPSRTRTRRSRPTATARTPSTTTSNCSAAPACTTARQPPAPARSSGRPRATSSCRRRPAPVSTATMTSSSRAASSCSASSIRSKWVVPTR